MAENTWATASPALSTEWLPALDIAEPGSQRRLTVLLRWLLLIPHFIVLWLLSIVAFFVTVIGWFGALIAGRLPNFAADYLTGFLGYSTRVAASAMLLVDAYPPFAFSAPADYPVRIEVRPGTLNRLAVFFRLILMIPAAIVANLLTTGWYAVSWIVWLIVLVLGRMPRPLFEATSAVTRYTMRLSAYGSMLSSAYPKRLFGDESDAAAGQPPVSATRPLLLSSGGRVLVVLFLVLGLLGGFFSGFGTTSGDSTSTYSAAARAVSTCASKMCG
jgi:Domain of unknown function (DUF4389)